MKEVVIFILVFFITLPTMAAEVPEIVPGSVDRAEGLQYWSKVHEVLSHPRCANCHVGSDNRPRWSGPSYGLKPGEWRYHGMNIDGGVDRIGATTVPCTVCHMEENSPIPHGPPGAEVWLLAPVEMEWFGKSSDEICNQLKDPDRNGERTLAEIAGHIDHDELVHWGWGPGSDRQPAPYSIQETVIAVTRWASAGAPCPLDVSQESQEASP